MTEYNRSWLIPLRFVAFLWLIKAAELLFHISFASFGIQPGSTFGLIGVLLSPLIHGNVYHLISNSIPLIILGTALFLLYPTVAYAVFSASYFLTGLLVWLIAPANTIHIGASGLLYGVAFFYSGIIFGVLPIMPGVSWQSHLMGALVGIGCASVLSRSKRLERERDERVRKY